jgi:hypothetical protein
MSGWQSGVLGWSIGTRNSGAAIELDQSLGECHVGVFAFSYHVLLWGQARELPPVWLFPQVRSTGDLVPFEPERWLLIDREELGRVAMGGDVRLRFDQSPVRFGNYIFESLQPAEVTKESCAFCNTPLRTYFRVGSQQACPDCTETFKHDMRANLARYYRRALGAGIAAAIAGGVIHAALSSFAHASFGSILIGALVGMALRIASKESAGTGYRVTAVVLTAIAGSLPWWRRVLPVGPAPGNEIVMPAVYLAVGLLAAWTLAARNAQTRIQGPFQSKVA